MYHLLYIDDEPDLLEIGRLFLEQGGEFAVDTITSAPAALDLMRSKAFDAVVADYQMPDMNGIELLKAIREQNGDIPFILFTGRGREEIVIEAINNGADFYLQKGGDPTAQFAELSHKIRQAVTRRRTKNELQAAYEQITASEEELRENYDELAKSQDALRESESRLRSFIENSLDSIVLVDEQGKVIEWNAGSEQLSGIPRTEALGQYLWSLTWSLLPPERRTDARRTAMEEEMRTSLATGIPVFTEPQVIEGMRRDGTRFFTRQTIFPIKTGKGFCFGSIAQDITREKRSEIALNESEQRYRAVFENTGTATSMLEEDSTISLVNSQFEKLSGYTRADVEGKKSWHEFVVPEDLAWMKEQNRLRREGGKGSLARYEFRFLTRAGEVRDILLFVGVIPGTKKTVASLLDITDRKRAEVAITESEKKFRTIFENSPYPMAITSLPDNKFLEVNAAFLAVSGYRPEEILGKEPIGLGLIPLFEATKLISRRVLEGKIENMPLALLLKDGRRFHVLFSTLPLTINNRPALVTMIVETTKLRRVEEELVKKNEELHATLEQLTATEEELRANYEELGRHEQALRESEENYRILTETSPDIIYMVNLKGIITHVSPRIARYGYKPGDVVSHYFAEFFVDEDIPAVITEMKKTLATREPAVTRMRLRDTAGAFYWMEDHGAAVVAPSGEITGIAGVLRDVTERLKAEDALRESEEKFRSFVETSPDIIWEIDLTGKFRYISPRVTTVLGYAPEELTGNEVAETVPGADRETVGRQLARHLEGKEELGPFDIPVRHRDGRRFILEIHPMKLVDPSGTLTGIRGVAIDVTERRRAEEAVKESEEKFRALVEYSIDGIFITDLDGNLLSANRASVTIVDAPELQDSPGTTSVLDFIAPDSREDLLRDYENVRRGKDGYLARYRLITRKNREIWVESIGKRILYKGSPALLVSMRDITEQKKAEDALRETEKNFRIMFEQHDSIMLLMDPDTGKILDANHAAERFYGRTRDELCAMSITDINVLPPEIVAAERAKAARAKSTIFTFPHRIAGGEIRTVEVHSSPIAIRGKTILFSIINDVTERRKTEDALRQVNAKLNLLSGLTRHDISNQLQVMNGFVGLLRQKVPDPAVEDYFSRIKNASGQISAMIQFSREYEQIGVQHPVWQGIKGLVDDAAKSASAGKVTIRNEIPETREVFADPLISRVFSNLIDNALRHGGKITTIRFGLERNDGGCTIVCEDDGDGIPRENKERIFERGFGKNTGFGLFLAREILDITGIAIKETGEEGKGARFEVIVPAGGCRTACGKD